MSEQDESKRVKVKGEWRVVQGSRLRIAMVFMFVMNSDQSSLVWDMVLSCAPAQAAANNKGPLQEGVESHNHSACASRVAALSVAPLCIRTQPVYVHGRPE
jgi:hypothetical protein